MKAFDVVLASGAEHLRNRFESLGLRVYSSSLNNDRKRFFPNSDIYVRIPDVEYLSGRRVVVIQSCTGSSPAAKEYWTTSDRVQELTLLLDMLHRPTSVEKTGFKEYRTTSIEPPDQLEVVLTFQPFALQDKAFKTGEAVSCRSATSRIAELSDTMWIVAPVVDNHYPWVQELIEEGAYNEINVTKRIIEYAGDKFGFEDYIVVAPDEGAQERFGVPGLKKRRLDSFSIEMYGEVDVEGRQVIVIDDVTKSGSTLLRASEILQSLGAKDVGLVVLHVMPLREGGEKMMEDLIEKSGGRLVTTNSVYTRAFCERHSELVYDMVDDIVDALRGHTPSGARRQ